MTHVIFACAHSAGPSQMAAALFNRAADPARAHAESAGPRPGRWVYPEVVEVMKEVGLDLVGARPQLLTPELAGSAALLVTLGCGDECPALPGLEREDWSVEDPRGQSSALIREVRDTLQAHIARLVAARGW